MQVITNANRVPFLRGRTRAKFFLSPSVDSRVNMDSTQIEEVVEEAVFAQLNLQYTEEIKEKVRSNRY